MQSPKNLDLVKEAVELKKQHPNTRLSWIKAHAGFTWNELADDVASSLVKLDIVGGFYQHTELDITTTAKQSR